MWKTQSEVKNNNNDNVVNRHRLTEYSSTLISSETSPNGFSRSSPSTLEILTEEDENDDEQQTKNISLIINRPHSSHSFSKHQSALPTIVESQDHQTNLEQTMTNSSEKLRQFKIEKRIYELLQQQRDVRQDKIRQYFFNFASKHCQNRKRIVS